jgi:hypothetical protein
VREIHKYVGYGVAAGFAVLTLWAAASFVRNRAPGSLFWTLLGGLQVILGIQIVVGGILFALGYRPLSNGPMWLHYAYGGLFPAVVLIVAHRVARRAEGIPWLVFGVAALVNFGLTFRALQTGLGVD